MIQVTNPELTRVLEREAAKATWRTWLVIMPASGTVMRYQGALLFVEVGGETKSAPFVVNREAAIVLDPRCLVVEEKTLICVYHPRSVLDKVHAMAAEWYAQNPDVFNMDIPAELVRI